MVRMEVERLAENYALGTYLTEWGELNYDEIIDALYKGNVPEDVIIWSPFESMKLEDLSDFIEITRNDFIGFYNRVKGVKE